LPKLPVSLGGFSIVQLSDIHLGSFLKVAWLLDAVENTNASLLTWWLLPAI